MDISDIIKNMIPITLFNKGKASQIFSRVNHNETLLAVKNNVPIAIISPPKEYELLRQLFTTCKKAREKGYPIESCEKIKELISEIDSFEESRGTS